MTPALLVDEEGDATVVRFTGECVELREDVTATLSAHLSGLMDGGGRRNWVLDFANVEFLTSAALGALVGLHKKAARLGGRLAVRNLDPVLYEIFAVTHLDRVLDVRPREAQGLPAVG